MNKNKISFCREFMVAFEDLKVGDIIISAMVKCDDIGPGGWYDWEDFVVTIVTVENDGTRAYSGPNHYVRACDIDYVRVLRASTHAVQEAV